MHRHPFFTLYWIGWVVAFIIPELYWVFTNSMGTLSENVWSLEGLNLAQPFDFPMWTATHWAVASIVWALFLWLSIHIPFGLLR